MHKVVWLKQWQPDNDKLSEHIRKKLPSSKKGSLKALIHEDNISQCQGHHKNDRAKKKTQTEMTDLTKQ